MIQNIFSSFLGKILLKWEISYFFSSSKQKEKTIFETNSKLHFLPQVSCQSEFNFSWLLYLLWSPPDDVLSKIADLSHHFKMLWKKLIWK